MIEIDKIRSEVVDRVLTAFQQGVKKGYIYLPTGAGKTITVAEIVNRFLLGCSNSKVLVVYRSLAEVDHFNEVIHDTSAKDHNAENTANNITAVAYPRLLKQKLVENINEFSLVVLFDSDYVHALRDRCNFAEFSGNLLGIFSHLQIPANNIFFESPALYLYHDHTTRFTEYWYIKSLIVPMLQQMGFSRIQTEEEIMIGSRPARADIVAVKNDVRYIIELKAYRGINNDQRIIQNAIYQIQSYKRALYSLDSLQQCFGIILLCDVDTETKKMLWESESIFIWDIKNLLYLCNTNPELMSALSTAIPYSLSEINSEEPLGLKFEKNSLPVPKDCGCDKHDLIAELTACRYGKGYATEYERICAEIIRFLFGAEFSQFSEQHKTRDAMFRMDILCALKGTTAFWQMLTHHYNTKFVVFEFKNYSKKIQQNLIYVTDKYLFNPALRNVAFIISRKGFDKHAHEAAMGILKESGKLIVDLTDDDLIKMILAKINGEEPSDYLLNKVELLLMSVSV